MSEIRYGAPCPECGDVGLHHKVTCSKNKAPQAPPPPAADDALLLTDEEVASADEIAHKKWMTAGSHHYGDKAITYFMDRELLIQQDAKTRRLATPIIEQRVLDAVEYVLQNVDFPIEMEDTNDKVFLLTEEDAKMVIEAVRQRLAAK